MAGLTRREPSPMRPFRLASFSAALSLGCGIFQNAGTALPAGVPAPPGPARSSASSVPSATAREQMRAAAEPVDSRDVPPELVEIVTKYAGADHDQANRMFEKFRAAAGGFDQRWKAYGEREAAVKAAIATATAQERAGNYKPAAQTLESVISRVPRSASGNLPRQRDLLEQRDAEFAAVDLLGKWVLAHHDSGRVQLVAEAYFTRHKVSGDRNAERLK